MTIVDGSSTFKLKFIHLWALEPELNVVGDDFALQVSGHRCLLEFSERERKSRESKMGNVERMSLLEY